MRIHVNLSNDHVSEFDRARVILITTMKLEELAYIDNPYEMTAGVKRCRWVRYRMEGGGGPQKHNRGLA